MTCYLVRGENRIFKVEASPSGEITLDGQPRQVDLQQIGGLPLYSLILDGRSYEVYVENDGSFYRVLLEGALFSFQVEDERHALYWPTGPGVSSVTHVSNVVAPIPGLVVSVVVQCGDKVVAGQSLVILEAMKMENELVAPRAGIVKEIHCQPHEVVEQGQVLVVIE